MTAPVVDDVVVSSSASTTSSQAEAKAADLLTFTIGMAAVAAVVITMAAVGAITGSAALLIAAGLTGTAASLTGVYTGVNLLAA